MDGADLCGGLGQLSNISLCLSIISCRFRLLARGGTVPAERHRCVRLSGWCRCLLPSVDTWNRGMRGDLMVTGIKVTQLVKLMAYYSLLYIYCCSF